MNEVKAVWTGKYPNLCGGTWYLEVNGHDVSEKIPPDRRHEEMYTYKHYMVEDLDGEYNYWVLGWGWKDWVRHNDYWLLRISPSRALKKQIFLAIQEQDFTQGCCGGCL